MNIKKSFNFCHCTKNELKKLHSTFLVSIFLINDGENL